MLTHKGFSHLLTHLCMFYGLYVNVWILSMKRDVQIVNFNLTSDILSFFSNEIKHAFTDMCYVKTMHLRNDLF